MKIAATIVLVFLALLGLLVGAGWWWWSSNQEELIAKGDAATAAGQAYGATHVAADCVEAGVAKAVACGKSSIMCKAESQIWTKGCLKAAPKPDAVCEGVPAADERIKTNDWILAECQARAETSKHQGCRAVMADVAVFCQR